MTCDGSKNLDISTTWGDILVELAGGQVVRCTLPFLEDTPTHPFAIESPCNDIAIAFISAIFEGSSATVPSLGKRAGTKFQRQVWNAISKIPQGQTRTYGEIASSIGRPTAVRAVANACGKNPVPLFIPCHRIVGANGRLGGFSAGLAWKQLLLQIER